MDLDPLDHVLVLHSPSMEFIHCIISGGCLSGEKCESIKGERWCCPIDEEEEDVLCPDGR